MKTEKRDDGYYITGIPETATEFGPYPTKAEAEEDRKGLQRTLDNWDDRSYFTCD